MLEHTRTHLIDLNAQNMDFFRVICPEENAALIKKYLIRKGCRVEEPVSQQAYPSRQ